jgi:hypothetical protein
VAEGTQQARASRARKPFIRSLSVPLLALATLWGTFGCGSNETSFTAAKFVATANEHGARLKLGDLLPSGSPDPHYEVEVVSSEPDPKGSGRAHEESADEHGGHDEHGDEGAHGTLRVTDGAGAAVKEHARCEQVTVILCFRAANVVLYFEEEHTDPTALAPLVSALRAIGKE